MITTFKIFENNRPVTFDYVLLNPEKLRGYNTLTIDKNRKEFKKFIENNAGQIVSSYPSNGYNIFSVVYYKEPHKNIKSAFMFHSAYKTYYVSTYDKNVTEFAKSLEELELKIAANKYNL